MPRELTSGMKAAIAGDPLRPLYFVKVGWGDGASPPGTAYTYHSTLSHSLVWDSQTWLGSAQFLGIGPVVEAMDIQPTRLSVALTGVDPTFIALADVSARVGKDVTIWLGAMDSDNRLINDPQKIWVSEVVGVSIRLFPNELTVIVNTEDEVARMRVPILRHFTHEDQQIVSAGDTGLKFMRDQVSWSGIWGSAAVGADNFNRGPSPYEIAQKRAESAREPVEGTDFGSGQ